MITSIQSHPPGEAQCSRNKEPKGGKNPAEATSFGTTRENHVRGMSKVMATLPSRCLSSPPVKEIDEWLFTLILMEDRHDTQVFCVMLECDFDRRWSIE
ncbi:hypothetical protein TNCV_3776251 [Trichonephila clavipes]|nr:hypothetical protein TNCV_3776251 [Trichonephila clavipes]